MKCCNCVNEIKKRKETCVSAQVEHFYTKFNCITTPHAIIKMIENVGKEQQ